MKTLKESLFDSDLVSKDMKVGDFYKFAEIPHYQIFQGDLDTMIKAFKLTSLKKFSEPKRKDVDNHATIYYYERIYKFGWALKSIINMILDMPAQIIPTDDYLSLVESGAEEKIQDYLKQYVNSSKLNDFHAMLRVPTRGKGSVCIYMTYRKNDICITLNKK